MGCTDLSGKEPPRQVGVNRVTQEGSICTAAVTLLTWNAKGIGSNHDLGLSKFPFSRQYPLTPSGTLILAESLIQLALPAHGASTALFLLMPSKGKLVVEIFYKVFTTTHSTYNICSSCRQNRAGWRWKSSKRPVFNLLFKLVPLQVCGGYRLEEPFNLACCTVS